MDLIKEIIAEAAKYQIELDNSDPFDPKQVQTRHTKSGEDYTYTDHGMFFNIGEFGCLVKVNFKFFSEWDDNSFDYNYGSQRGTHVAHQGYAYTLEDFQIVKYQYTDDNGEDLSNPINIMKVSGGIAALEAAVENVLVHKVVPQFGEKLEANRPQHEGDDIDGD